MTFVFTIDPKCKIYVRFFFAKKKTKEFRWTIVVYIRIHSNFKGTNHGRVLQNKKNSLSHN